MCYCWQPGRFIIRVEAACFCKWCWWRNVNNWLLLFFSLSFFFSNSTLNNNNITRIPVTSFNHMPKIRTLWVLSLNIVIMGVCQLFEFLSSCDNLISVLSRLEQFSVLLRSKFAEQTWPCESWGRPGRLGHPKGTPQWGSLNHLRDRAGLRLGQARPSPCGWAQAQTRPMAGQGGLRQGSWCSPRLAKMGP